MTDLGSLTYRSRYGDDPSARAAFQRFLFVPDRTGSRGEPPRSWPTT